ncbi:MAG TPA: hypothetical protein VFT22_07075 [Kofleriaceae bacterium]|nr:hypothetical protein [Kofleriaceae bacterium]
MAEYDAETLTVEDVRLWYRLYGSMHALETALHASPELREHMRLTLPAFEEPKKEYQDAARRWIADQLNVWDGVGHE